LQYILALLLVLLSSTQAFAHVLETDGPIGAVFHVSPDDDPIAGEPADFFFEFKDRENRFTPSQCDCTVAISQHNEEIFVSSLTAHSTDPNLESASFSFTFPQKDIYTITITGKPMDGKAFTPFTLKYDLRVEREKQATRNDEPFLQPLVLIIGLSVLVLASGVYFLRKRR
jgi:hypothetical protein